MHDTYIQSEKLFEEIQAPDDLLYNRPMFKKHTRTTLIKQFQAYVKELEGEMHKNLSEMQTGSEFMTPRMYKAIAHNDALNLAIDKANNFIKYLEQR